MRGKEDFRVCGKAMLKGEALLAGYMLVYNKSTIKVLANCAIQL